MVDWKERVECGFCGREGRAPGWSDGALRRAGYSVVGGIRCCRGCVIEYGTSKLRYRVEKIDARGWHQHGPVLVALGEKPWPPEWVHRWPELAEDNARNGFAVTAY